MEKKHREYYIGLDIGTDSVGYAVTDETYHVRVFDTYTPFSISAGIEMPIFFCQFSFSLFHVTLCCGII